jgi:hypothetical protein
VAEEKEKPLTREDVLKLIEENGGKAEGLDLSGKRFEEGIDLHELNLGGIILATAHLERAKLWGAHLEGANLRGAHLEGADLVDAHLQGADLSGAHLIRRDLIGVELTRDTRLQTVHWGKNYILGEETARDFDMAVHIYRQLKQWYTNAGMHDTAAKFYYREKEATRKSLKRCSRHRVALQLLRVFFGYGERWQRVLCWMAFVVFGSAVAYFLFGGLAIPYSLYFSVISFTALGYGKWVDITPPGWVQALGAFESFTGVFLMALLLVTFFRKWTR